MGISLSDSPFRFKRFTWIPFTRTEKARSDYAIHNPIDPSKIGTTFFKKLAVQFYCHIPMFIPIF